MTRILMISVLSAGLSATLVGAADDSDRVVSIDNSTVAFSVATNVPAVGIKGKSSALRGNALVRHSGEALELERIRAIVPVKTLSTGMGLRDEHMRKYIFTTPDGGTPELVFEAAKASCVAGRECVISGNLSIRGVGRRVSIPFKIREENAVFKALGDTVIQLSDFGIDQPSQFGVKTANEVQLHFELTGRESRPEGANAGGSR